MVSALALSCYYIASRMLQFGLFGLLAYLEPALLVGVALLLGEGIAPGQWLTYVPIWSAVVVLVAEGPTARAKKLLVEERRKVDRLASGSPVHLMRVGDAEAEGQTGDVEVVPVRKLASKVQRLKPVLTKEEVAVVNKRLKAMTGARAGAGVPAGMDPTRARVDRKGVRGR